MSMNTSQAGRARGTTFTGRKKRKNASNGQAAHSAQTGDSTQNRPNGSLNTRLTQDKFVPSNSPQGKTKIPDQEDSSISLHQPSTTTFKLASVHGASAKSIGVKEK